MQQRKSRYEDLRRSVITKIARAPLDLNVVVMPDFFLDHVSTFGFDARKLVRRVLSVASRGGGEIPDVHQSLEVGGNAAICALALAKLGATVQPMMKTDALGLLLMRYFYGGSRVNLDRIKLTGSLTPTTILEVQRRGGSTNIMLGDSSHVRPFSFEDLDPQDLDAIKRSHYVCVFNWLYNEKGADLSKKVFQYCHENSRAVTFFDAADPTPRANELPELNRKVLRRGLIDFWGLNEHEALTFAGLYKRNLKPRRASCVLEAGKIVSTNTGAKVYLHTADYSASIRDVDVTVVPAFSVKPRRGTGAGDSWNAAIMVADRLGLSEEERLLFANAVAGRYVSNPNRVYSTLAEMVEFLKDPGVRLKRVV
ncbi:MAG TPA: carbohydrate kinase family protein [Candidatus Acidoferrales bacterium]|nr:carbohydrate kinase family protein [Candidatus Acidoferrales bacterium]